MCAETVSETNEIEITDDMIDAGVRAWSNWDRHYEEPEGLVMAVFLAMFEKYQAQRQKTP